MERTGAEETRRDWPSRTAWLVFAGGSVVSAILVFWFGRNLTFTGDELSLVSLVVQLESGELFDPYVGHLVPIPLLAYKAIIETLGTGHYAAFQALSVLAIVLLGAGMLCWAVRRVSEAVALVPVLITLLFTGDLLHLLFGNGFVILFSVACGVWALVVWDRGTRGGDLIAFVLLILALMTYTVGAAFAVGLLLSAAFGNRRRLWVAGLPLFAYALWRLFVASSSVELEDGGIVWENLLLLPAWAFQATGLILESMAGMGFDFLLDPNEGEGMISGYLAPSLAAGFLLLVLLRAQVGRLPREFWLVAAITAALFASQVLIWGSFEARSGPGRARYLYPGIVVVLLMLIEIARGITWDRRRVRVLWVAGAIVVTAAIGSLVEPIERLERGAGLAKAETTAAFLLETTAEPPRVGEQPRAAIRKSFDASATAELEDLRFDEASLTEIRTKYARAIDLFLAESLNLRLQPIQKKARFGNCRPAAVGVTSPATRVALGDFGTVLFTSRTLYLKVGRFGDRAERQLGPLFPGRPARLFIPADDGLDPWYLEVGARSSGTMADLYLCDPLPAGRRQVSSGARNRNE
jgi:hypothetical protein